MNNKCINCKNLEETIYMVFEKEILYNYYCKLNISNIEECKNFIEKDN